MADCYIVRRGGTDSGEKDNTNTLVSFGIGIVIPPIEDVFISEETEE